MEIFCGALEHTDHQAGRIVEAIEQTGDLENTLIIYIAGDNGPSPEGGLHGTLNKLSYFNGVAESLDEVAATSTTWAARSRTAPIPPPGPTPPPRRSPTARG